MINTQNSQLLVDAQKLYDKYKSASHRSKQSSVCYERTLTEMSKKLMSESVHMMPSDNSITPAKLQDLDSQEENDRERTHMAQDVNDALQEHSYKLDDTMKTIVTSPYEVIYKKIGHSRNSEPQVANDKHIVRRQLVPESLKSYMDGEPSSQPKSPPTLNSIRVAPGPLIKV